MEFMGNYERVLERWKMEVQTLLKRPEFGLLQKNEFTLESYRWYLRETYYHTRENPISQLIATRSFSRSDHDVLSKYVGHARSEISHDQLALNDFVSLGGSEAEVRSGQPLPDTEALIGYTYSCAYSDTPLKYLGYLFHVEALPTIQGKDYIRLLLSSGVPASAVSFLEEHAQVDPAHSKLMSFYLDRLLPDEKAERIFELSMRTGMLLHYRMIVAAISKGMS
jgi:pyrroloquinoline quinone (PQQ) biosynthesis protein C